jgi:hypothetical protein
MAGSGVQAQERRTERFLADAERKQISGVFQTGRFQGRRHPMRSPITTETAASLQTILEGYGAGARGAAGADYLEHICDCDAISQREFDLAGC